MGGCISWMLGFGGTDSAPPRVVAVNGKQYSISAVLGEGGFATVYRAKDCASGREVALKRVRFTSEKRALVEQEVRFLAACATCDYVIKLIDSEIRGAGAGSSSLSTATVPQQNPGTDGSAPIATSTFDGECWLVLELCGRSAFDILQERIGQVRLMQRAAKDGGTNKMQVEGCLPVQTVAAILDSVVHAVAFMHRMSPVPIAHWDLKLQNILMAPAGDASLGVADHVSPGGGGGSGRAYAATTAAANGGPAFKVCDFGSATQQRVAPCANARHVNVASVILEERMTLAYRPPEALDLWQRHAVDQKADTWAIGVMLYTLICARLPFEEVAREIIEAKFAPFPAAVTSVGSPFAGLASLVVEGLLVADPTQRWSVFELSRRLALLFPSAHTAAVPPAAPLTMLDFPMPDRSAD